MENDPAMTLCMIWIAVILCWVGAMLMWAPGPWYPILSFICLISGGWLMGSMCARVDDEKR